MCKDPYKQLAEHLDALPNGFPPTEDGRELKLLAKLFTPEEAGLAAQLSSAPETAPEIARRTARDAQQVRKQLKALARRGLIAAEIHDGAVGFHLMPFIVGFYEWQFRTIDPELARLAEDYFVGGFGRVHMAQPPFHRVVPTHDAVHEAVEVRPFESAVEIVNAMQSWGVLDCICRKQQALIGKPCRHPIEMCMAMDPHPNAFQDAPGFRVLNREQALAMLKQAADLGLVHTVTNSVEGINYICNCCTCSCGLLRGMAEFGAANVVASSPFVNQVDPLLCDGCEACIEPCQFRALSMQDAVAVLDRERCVGCGVCVIACPRGALGLLRRPADEVLPIPRTHADWEAQRLAARGMS